MRPFSLFPFSGRRERERERDPRVGRGCVAVGGSGTTSGRRCKKETGSSRYKGGGRGMRQSSFTCRNPAF